MRFFYRGKDGGDESTVTGFWLIELKWLFSIVLLRFDHGTREAFHNHAFDAISWVLGRGYLVESFADGRTPRAHFRSCRPIITRRGDFHRVRSYGRTWALSLRGPWTKTWLEYLPSEDRFVELGHGRREVS